MFKQKCPNPAFPITVTQKNTAQYGPQIEFMTKHRMFSLKAYPSPENFTRRWSRWL